jgi:hypothetical protein
LVVAQLDVSIGDSELQPVALSLLLNDVELSRLPLLPDAGVPVPADPAPALALRRPRSRWSSGHGSDDAADSALHWAALSRRSRSRGQHALAKASAASVSDLRPLGELRAVANQTFVYQRTGLLPNVTYEFYLCYVYEWASVGRCSDSLEVTLPCTATSCSPPAPAPARRRR